MAMHDVKALPIVSSCDESGGSDTAFLLCLATNADMQFAKYA